MCNWQMISILLLSSESWSDLKIVDLYTYFVFIFGKHCWCGLHWNAVINRPELLNNQHKCTVFETNLFHMYWTRNKTFAIGPDLRTANQEALITGWLARLMLVQVDTCPHRAKPTLIVNETHYCNATILEEVTYQATALMLRNYLASWTCFPRLGFVAD